uniref:Uncharacterized protein n=1 Tax=viral metagenome TaxID=1070528 RepID=A0A6C0ESL9_9ZZZZ
MTTIVTSYFQLNQSKASHLQYVEWMKNMLMIDTPMVIFCDEKSEEIIYTLRTGKHDKTRIIITNFKEFYSYKYANHFLEHYKMDKEQHVGHNMFLYMIWSEKSNFMKRAIELDPFKTEYFLWVDIGCFRRPNTEYINWPNPQKIKNIDKRKVLLLLVQSFTHDEWQCNRLEKLPSFQSANRIGGTMFGGGKDVLLKWHEKYYEMLEYFISINRFIGKDQSIINSVYLLNKQMCQLVTWQPGCPDPWFYLQEYLR